MRIHRSNPKRFVALPNATVRDHGLSFTARGILGYLVSLPNGSREDIKSLAKRSREGRTAVARAMKELETAGYLKRVTTRTPGGLIGTELVVSDVPMPDEPEPANPGVGLSDEKTIEDGISENPNRTPGAPAAPVGSGVVEMTRSEKALAGLAAIDARLHLAARDVASLTPIADLWFERGVDERRFAAVLTLDLPDTVKHPAAFLKRRLLDKMPAERAALPPVTPSQPLRYECPDCDRPVASEGPCKACSVLDAPPAVAARRNDWRQLGRQFGADAFALESLPSEPSTLPRGPPRGPSRRAWRWECFSLPTLQRT